MMNLRSPMIASIVLMGVMFFGAGSASATVPAGHVTCSGVWGYMTAMPNLSNVVINSAWHVKGQGWFWNCDNSLNTGDPVMWGYFKLSGFHVAPRTCASALTFGYTAKLKMQWHTTSATYSTGGVVVNSGLPFGNHNFQVGQLFTTVWQPPFTGSLAPLIPIHIDATGLAPINAATLCTNGTYNQFIYYIPGQVSF